MQAKKVFKIFLEPNKLSYKKYVYLEVCVLVLNTQHFQKKPGHKWLYCKVRRLNQKPWLFDVGINTKTIVCREMSHKWIFY